MSSTETQTMSGGNQSESASEPTSKVVLVMNHNKDELDDVATALARNGYEVRLGTCLAQSHRLAGEDRPDVVLLNPLVICEDGVELELLERIQQEDDPIPVILLVDDLRGLAEARNLQVPFRDFVLKPFEPAVLRRRLGLLLGRVAPTPADTAAIDRRRLRQSAVGDPAGERRLAALFIDEGARAAPALLDAAAADDRPRLRAAAHSLKGQAAYVGATAVVDALVRVEGLADASAPPGGAVEAAAEATAALADAIWALRVLYPPDP